MMASSTSGMHTPLVSTMSDLKSYVTGGAERQTAEGVVLLNMTHNLLKAQYAEIKFELDWSIERAKDKVYTMTGSKPEYMVISLDGNPLLDDSLTLRQCGAQNGMTLHCNDTDPYSGAKGGQLEDVSLVKKYIMSDEDYDKRENTYRAFKKKMLAQDPNWKPKHIAEEIARREAARPKLEDESDESVYARMKVGDRCEAMGGRRGEIMYIGKVPEIATEYQGIWVGIKFDEAEGSNNGTLKGKKYFDAEDKHGSFMKPQLVQAGDYPEVDPFASDEEDVMEEL